MAESGHRPPNPERETRNGHSCYSWRDHEPGPVQQAIDNVLHVMTDHWDFGFCPAFSCSEAEELAEFIRMFRGDEAAEMFLWAHSATDDDPEDDHFEMEDPRVRTG